jgi:hypothetical protein
MMQEGLVSYFELPSSEADEILIRMISLLQERFLFDSSHGLDSYLSQRIRHGSIQNYLRNPVEEAQLVTQKDSQTGKYQANNYWLERFNEAHAEIDAVLKWSRLFEQIFRVAKWSLCRG